METPVNIAMMETEVTVIVDMETTAAYTAIPPTLTKHWSAPLAITCDVISLVLNVFPILVVYKLKRKEKRLNTDILIASLSFTDQLCILFPLAVTLIALSGAPNNRLCRFYYFFVFWFQNSAMLIVMTLSCERFLAVVFPFKYKSLSSQKRTYLAIFGVYIFAFIIAISTVTELESISTVGDSSLRICISWLLLVPTYSRGLFPSILIIEGWLSMLIVLICNAWLIKHLLRYKRLLSIGSPSVGLSRQHLRDFTKMVILITILFYVTWLPVLCVMTFIQFGKSVGSSVASVCIMATSINGLVNPFVYLGLSKQYRQGYRILLASMLNRIGIHCLDSGVFVITSSSYQTANMRVNGSTRKPPQEEEDDNQVTML